MFFEQRDEETLAGFDAAVRLKGGLLAGTDEVGRGPLAGPVVAAAVILDPQKEYPGVNDSKKIKMAQREKFYEIIAEQSISWAWAAVEADEVDRINPLAASMLAMSRAVEALRPVPDLLLVDGNSKPPVGLPCRTVVKGDQRSLSIAAASIMAKVTRDRIMLKWHEQYPQYGFDRHMGYGTKDHLAALRRHGPCPIHRLSYRGVAEAPEQPPLLGFM